jgi:hypothetical protein
VTAASRNTVSGSSPVSSPGHLEVATLDAVGVGAVEQPARPGEPAARLGRRTDAEQAEADPEAAARGARCVARIDVEHLGSFQRAMSGVVAAEQVRRGRQRLQVGRAQRLLAVGRRELGERVAPRPSPIARPAPRQNVGGWAPRFRRGPHPLECATPSTMGSRVHIGGAVPVTASAMVGAAMTSTELGEVAVTSRCLVSTATCSSCPRRT